MGVYICWKHRKIFNNFYISSRSASAIKSRHQHVFVLRQSRFVIHFSFELSYCLEHNRRKNNYTRYTYVLIFHEHPVLYVMSQIHNWACETYGRLKKERPFHVLELLLKTDAPGRQ
jgi:hypothetical protein